MSKEKTSLSGRRAEANRKFTVADGTVPEVIEFAEEHPEAVEAMLAAEKASDKPRKGIVGAAVFEDATPAKKRKSKASEK